MIKTNEKTEHAVLDYAIDIPTYGQVRTSNELRKQGVWVSPSSVRSIWLRHQLASFKDRLKALEAKVAFAKLYTSKSPRINGICERFHKLILQEFYQIAFCKNLYENIETLQNNLDDCINYHNNDRTYQDKMCCGRTLIET